MNEKEKRLCKYCGREIPSERPRSHFCSDKCIKNAWYKNNRDKAKADHRRWRENNYDKYRVAKSRYVKNNRDKIRVASAKSRSKLRHAVISIIAEKNGHDRDICGICGKVVGVENIKINHEQSGGYEERMYWFEIGGGQKFLRAIRDGERPVHGYTSPDGQRWGSLQNICKSCHNKFHRHGPNIEDVVRSEMNDVLEVLSMAKLKNGRLGNDRTVLDEERRLTFGYVNDKNRIVEVKIPIDGVEITTS